MNNNLKNKEEVLRMMSLSDEINALNLKVKQLVEDLSGTQNVLGSVQELTAQLTSKVGELSSASNSYEFNDVDTTGVNPIPSHTDGVNKRDRVVPTPENYKEYMPEPVQPVAQPTTATTKTDGDNRGISEKQEFVKKTKQSRVAKKKTPVRNNKKKAGGAWGFGNKND